MNDPFKNWNYNKTYKAIAAATKIDGGNISISVQTFVESFGPFPKLSDHQTGLLVSSIQRCLVASNIVRADAALTGPDLLLFMDDLARHLETLEVQKAEPDCEFIAFKDSGKYYTSGKGYYPRAVDNEYVEINRDTIAVWNGGVVPGLSGRGEDFTIIVRPLDNCTIPTAHPRALQPGSR